jgi:cellulose synthase operon protein C
VVIALSPRGGEFNWGQIVWHELSHVFHVQRSRGRVPRWFTEGLAEWETARARPEWRREDDRALYDALPGLPDLAGFNRAFTHAADGQALMVAYYASSLAIEYFVSQYGFDKIVSMLGLWGESLDSEQVMQRAIGRSLAELSREFRAWLAQRLQRYERDFRVDLTRFRDLATWRQRSAAPGASTDDHAGLALALALAGESRSAVTRAEALLREIDQPIARFTLVHVALEAGDLERAARELDTLLSTHDGYQPRMLRARVADTLGDPARARIELEAAIAIDPERSEAYELLARVSPPERERAYLALARLDQHQRGPLLRALALLRERHAYPELLALAESGLYRDVHAPAIHAALAEAFLHMGRPVEARQEAERAGPEAADLLRAIPAQKLKSR